MKLLYLPFLISAIAILAAAGHFFTSRLKTGAVLILATFLYDVLLVNVPPITSGVQLYPVDIIFLVLFAAAILRYAMGRTKLGKVRWILMGMIALFFSCVIRGLALYGIKDVGNASREWFYFLAGMLYFSSFKLRPRLLKKVVDAWMVISLILVAIAIFRWLATLAGLAIAEQWASVGVSSIRVLNAQQDLFLAVAFFASLSLNLANTGPQWQRKAFYLLGPVIFLLQHRTVWIVVIVGILWLGLWDPRFRKRAVVVLAGMAISGVLLTIVLFQREVDVATSSLENSSTNEDSFVWRVAGWYQLLFNNPAMTPINEAIGEPFGTGFTRVVAGTEVDVAPHNWYVETFLRFGVVGSLLQLALYWLGIRRMRRLPPQLQSWVYPNAQFWSLVLLTQLVFFFSYSATFVGSILTGLALAGFGLKANDNATVHLSAAPVIPIDPA